MIYDMIYDRFDLEDSMSKMLNIDDELEDLIYKVGDSKTRPTEDEILNMLIGIKALNQARYERMWQIFETCVKDGIISNRTKYETTE